MTSPRNLLSLCVLVMTVIVSTPVIGANGTVSPVTHDSGRCWSDDEAAFNDTASHDLRCYLRDPAMSAVLSLLFEEGFDCDGVLCKQIVPKSGN